MPAQLLLTDAIAESLAAAVRDGVPLEVAAQASGISRTQVYDWLQVAQRQTWPNGTPVDPATIQRLSVFSEQIARARAEREAAAVQRIQEAARTVGRSGVLEWRADAWYLEHAPSTRERWGQTIQITQTGTIQHEHTLVKELSDEALEAAYNLIHQADELPPLSG